MCLAAGLCLDQLGRALSRNQSKRGRDWNEEGTERGESRGRTEGKVGEEREKQVFGGFAYIKEDWRPYRPYAVNIMSYSLTHSHSLTYCVNKQEIYLLYAIKFPPYTWFQGYTACSGINRHRPIPLQQWIENTATYRRVAVKPVNCDEARSMPALSIASIYYRKWMQYPYFFADSFACYAKLQVTHSFGKISALIHNS